MGSRLSKAQEMLGHSKNVSNTCIGGEGAAVVPEQLVRLRGGRYVHTVAADQVKVSVDKDTSVTVEGPDKQKVGLVAAELRGFYPVEPYKGKGVKYADEHVRRKEGKTVQ